MMIVLTTTTTTVEAGGEHQRGEYRKNQIYQHMTMNRRDILDYHYKRMVEE